MTDSDLQCVSRLLSIVARVVLDGRRVAPVEIAAANQALEHLEGVAWQLPANPHPCDRSAEVARVVPGGLVSVGKSPAEEIEAGKPVGIADGQAIQTAEGRGGVPRGGIDLRRRAYLREQIQKAVAGYPADEQGEALDIAAEELGEIIAAHATQTQKEPTQ